MKTRIDLEAIALAHAAIKHLNGLDLQEVEFYRDGKPVALAPEEVARFQFTGLSNLCFVRQVLLGECVYSVVEATKDAPRSGS